MECTGEFENIPRNQFTSRYVKMVLRSSFAGSLEFLDPGEAPYTDKYLLELELEFPLRKSYHLGGQNVGSMQRLGPTIL